MKKIFKVEIALFSLTFLVFGCIQSTSLKEKIEDKNDDLNIVVNSSAKNHKTTKSELTEFIRLDDLIPLDTIDPKSNNVYEKYGLEFSGNCYACDLANITISDNLLKLTNVCSENPSQSFQIKKIINKKNEIVFKTAQHDFVFNEVDKAPIYKLSIVGDEISQKNLRISQYYTLKKLLKKFKVHDCGDFGG